MVKDNMKYFLSAHTSDGFVSHIEDLSRFENVLIISHPSVHWTTLFLQKVIQSNHLDCNYELILSSSGDQFLEGVVFPKFNIAIVTNTFAVSYEDCIKGEKIALDLPHFNFSNKYIDYYFKTLDEAYELLAKGLQLHEYVEEIYISEMDFTKADLVAKRTISNLLKNVSIKNEKPRVKNKFFGTNTPFGSQNIVPSLLQRVNKVDFIHGRSGTGKSTLMKKLAKEVLKYGYSIEVYYCSFDPSSVDMVLVPDLDYCIMDATEPHAFYPTEKGHNVIDTYEEFIAAGTDEKYEDEIKKRTISYKEKVNLAKNKFQQSGAFFSKIESPFLKNEQLFNERINEIVDRFIKQKL